MKSELTPHPIRKYPRAYFHDYNGSAYFITVCTKEKKPYFGEIVNNKMYFSPLGNALNRNIADIQIHHSDIEIPLWVVMPNHFHAIVYIVGSRPAATASTIGRLNQLGRLSVATGRDPTLTTHHNSRLSVTVGGIKSHVTRFARRNNIKFAWQPRYHEHIIRGYELNKIAEYIENNVARWADDCFAK